MSRSSNSTDQGLDRCGSPSHSPASERASAVRPHDREAVSAGFRPPTPSATRPAKGTSATARAVASLRRARDGLRVRASLLPSLRGPQAKRRSAPSPDAWPFRTRVRRPQHRVPAGRHLDTVSAWGSQGKRPGRGHPRGTPAATLGGHLSPRMSGFTDHPGGSRGAARPCTEGPGSFRSGRRAR